MALNKWASRPKSSQRFWLYGGYVSRLYLYPKPMRAEDAYLAADPYVKI